MSRSSKQEPANNEQEDGTVTGDWRKSEFRKNLNTAAKTVNEEPIFRREKLPTTPPPHNPNP
jgi:hypothetical protein